MKIKYSPALLVNLNKDLFRWKVDAYPALVYATCHDMTKTPYGWPKSETFFRGTDFYWYSNWVSIWSNGNKYIKKYLKNSSGSLPVNCVKKYDIAFKSLNRKIKKISKLDFTNLNLSELRQEWFDFFTVYTNFWATLAEVEVVNYITSYRLEKLVVRQKKIMNKEDISQLVIFPQKSYFLEEEYELLKIANIKIKDKREQSLSKHVNKFSWILNGYHGLRVADESFFYQRLQTIIKDKEHLKRYNYLKNYYSEINKRFKIIVKQYKLDKEIIKYAKLAQASSYLQDKRKALSWRATTYIVKMYQNLAKFLNISLEQSLYILWDEFDLAIKNKKKILVKIIKRQKSCRLRISGNQTIILTNDVDEIFSLFEKKYIESSGKNIKGVVACTGKVIGRVQIITSGRQLPKFLKGSILVTQMTSPDYVVAMRKAQAIITDDGGLTCHAAIIARELKKPCIVGTRNATSLLKDGDLVEVNANQGIVKILKK